MLKKLFLKKKVFYNHHADKREKKWNVKINLVKENAQNLPNYIIENENKFKDWLD